MIFRFISEMSPKQRNIFFVALFIGLCAAFDRLLLSPTFNKIEKIDQQIQQEETAIRADLKVLARKPQITKENQDFDAYYAKTIPSEQEIFASFLKNMEYFANQSGVNSMKISPAGQQHTEQYLQYLADIECSGKFDDIVEFMHSIDSSKQLVKITKFNLNGKRTDTEELKATISVSFMLITAGPQKIKNPAASAGDSMASAK